MGLGPRVRGPQIYRLAKGHKAWVPEGHLGLALLLSSHTVDIHLRDDATSLEHCEKWDAHQALFYIGGALVAEDRVNFSLAIYELEPNGRDPTLP